MSAASATPRAIPPPGSSMDAPGDASRSARCMRSGAVVYSACWCDLLDAARWRYAERVQIGYASLRAPIQELVFPIPSHLTVCPYLSSDLLASPTASRASCPLRPMPGARVLLLRRQRPGDARHSVGQRNCNEHRSACAPDTGQPRVRRLATSGGVPYGRHRARDQKPPEVALAHLGYLAQPGLAAGPLERARAMREVAPAPKALCIGGAKACSDRSDWPDPHRHEAHRLFVLAGAGVHILLQSAYLLVETSNLLKQKAGQLADLLR